MTDLVVVSLERWDEVWRRNQYLIHELLGMDADLRVLFVEPAVDPLHSVAKLHTRPRRGRGLRAITDSAADGRLWGYEPTKPLPRRLDPGYDRRTARRIARLVSRLGFDRPVLWINDPGGAWLVHETGWPTLYDITDDWLLAARDPAEHNRLVREEGYLLRHCAEVVVCSHRLQQTKGVGRSVTLIPNAVDVADYQRPRPRPSDLPNEPVALYLGTIHTDRMDLDLCVATADALSGAGRLVLVGPIALSAADRNLLTDHGVMLLGAKPKQQVPGYLQHADVLVVPHVVTPFTDSLDPIKLYEYRAVGRPVVATPVAGFREEADRRIQLVRGQEFARAVRAALPASTRFPMGADDSGPTWRDRAVAMRQVIDRVQSAATPGRPDRLSG